MSENTDSTKLTTELLFTLDVRIPEQTPRRFEVLDRVLAGIDPRNDLILVDPKVSTKHFLFRKRNNILTVHYLGRDAESFLNGLPLEKGKLYILEKGDILKVGKIEIIIRRETAISKTIGVTSSKKEPLTDEPYVLENIPDITEAEAAPEKPKFKKVKKKSYPISNHKIEANVKEPIFDFRTFNLIPYKVYGFLVDIALTYAVLGFALPSLGVMSLVQDFLYPISEFSRLYLITNYPEFPTHKILSVLEFFICFHALMIPMSLILGSSPGAFLVGVHQKGSKNFLAVRFKAYIYALLNIVALPLLFFDIPLYKGRTIKELLSFSAHEVNTSLVFRISRKALAPLIIIASLLSPFFLLAPYNANITKEVLSKQIKLETHTNTIRSTSKEFGIALDTDLQKNYAILPLFEKKKLGLLLYDFTTKKTLSMKEEGRINNDQAFFKSRYANPLESLYSPAGLVEGESLKNLVIKSFDLSLTNLLPGLAEYGPFLANGFLFKDEFLKGFDLTDDFLYNSFAPKNPVIKISNSAKLRNAQRNVHRVFFFTRNEIVEFNVLFPKQTKLLEILSTSVLSAMRFDQSSNDGLDAQNEPQLLEVLEAFERSNYQTLLTYYINEAKKAEVLQNSQWKSTLLKNLEQTKRALFEDGSRQGLTKNIEKSFDDIINALKVNETEIK